MTSSRLVLGSRSPRRRELLSLLVPPEQIEICAPNCADEAGFDKLTTWLDIAQRLQAIARAKNEDVREQLSRRTLAEEQSSPPRLVLTADTVIIATDADGGHHVLGRPPNDVTWPDVVRSWFRELYAGRSHIATTAVCLSTWPGSVRLERLVQSHVWFHDNVDEMLDWYLATGEPLGKAGGYALQGLASVFVQRIDGSLTNVVGLPLEALLDMLPQLGWSLDERTFTPGAY
jgi:nucleoside triphosphate pyrophosphatase